MSGAVVDFIDVQFWPIWNVADMAVVVGGILLAVLSAFAPAEQPDEPDDATEPTEPAPSAAEPDEAVAAGDDRVDRPEQ
jgi:signal peptidase II